MNKTKFFSSLLVGAMFLASASVVTSCKDYDGDINDLRTQIDQKAVATELASLKSSLESELSTLKASVNQDAARIAAVETQLKAIDDALNGASGVKATLAALTGKLENEADAREAADLNLQLQIEALQAWQKSIQDADLQKQIDDIVAQLQNMETSGTIQELREQMNRASEEVTQMSSSVNILNVLVNKILTSISLVPNLYVGGIETIEFKSLEYKVGNQNFRIDNGVTEATYRLNPSTVERASIDEDNMEFFATQAETRSASTTSPVLFNGIKSFNNGLMTVYLKKNTTASLNLEGNKIWIVALNTPRKADAEKGVEAANIVSENSRLIETVGTPKIASLPYRENMSAYNEDGEYRPHLYSSENEIYNSRVDNDPLESVAKKIYYKDAFDLNEIVTGCFETSAAPHAHANELSKDELKSYGLELRYSIPAKVYNLGAPNATDQQQFGSVTPNGIITSKTPAGVTDNEAVVGKEPIVCVSLIDVNHNNNLVDQRYFKIKWILNKMDAIQLSDKASEATLGCEDVVAEYRWDEFVNEVYAKMQNATGMSQSKFKTVYGDNPTITAQGWTTNWNPTTATSASAVGTDPTAVPVWQATTNLNGDALVGTWTLTADQISTVYANSANDTKTFTAKVYFNSLIPSEYPDIWFNWTFTIKLPTLPSINGFYDQYWLENMVGQAHDVLPVQYNTPGAIAYCRYFNNLMNAFTYTPDPKFIVKDLRCGTWDMQFRYEQTMTGYRPDYTSTSSEARKSGNQWTNIVKDVYTAFEPYKLMKSPFGVGTQALQLIWDDGHESWCGSPSHYQAILFADHNNVNNQSLLNPLAQTDVVGPDGTVAPDRTHTKPIDMTVWATLNPYNYIPVLNYQIYLVEPLRINQTTLGNFQDGVVSGDILNLISAFNLTDFRGYLVSQEPNGTYSAEQKKWTQSLWNYYEIGTYEVDENEIRYTFYKNNGDLSIDNTLPYANSMTSSEIENYTNGNIVLSMKKVGDDLVFKNNGGSNIEAKVKAYIPVKVTYGFGTLKAVLEAWIYPHGQKP